MPSATCTLLIGSEENRMREVAEVVTGISDRITVQLLSAETQQTELNLDCRLVMITDANPSTLAQLDRITQSVDATVLKLACVPVEDVGPRMAELLGKVDDVLIHPDELEIRLLGELELSVGGEAVQLPSSASITPALTSATMLRAS